MTQRSVMLSIIFLLTVSSLGLVISADDIECFAEGECTQSLFLGQYEASDAQDCLDICREHDGCQFFTYLGQDDTCVNFANCVVLDDKNCEECYSGNRTCEDLQCWVSGSCVGTTISIDSVSNEDDCLDMCKSEAMCKWITFDKSDDTCIRLTECFAVEATDCDTCWSSQVQCGDRKDFTKALVIGGYNDGIGLDNVEAIDMSTEVSNCDSVSNYPMRIAKPVGTILEDLPTVCGGKNEDPDLYTNECYQYLYEENQWTLMDQTMVEARFNHKASMVNSATWLITGGRNNDQVILHSSEVYSDGQFHSGPVLPNPIRGHCQLTLNSSYVAILGGYNGTEYLHYFDLLDWENEDWISMPDVPVTLNSDPCGFIENSVNGLELVILADYDDCYIFNFGGMTWREGPSIPYDIMIISDSMPVQMEKTFYIMGGYLGTDTATDVIFKFDNENYEWRLETFTLETSRYGGVAIAMPDEMVDCN